MSNNGFTVDRRTLLKLLLFGGALSLTPFTVPLLYPEPKTKKRHFEIGKRVDLEKAKFLPGIYGGTLYTATSSDPKTFNLVLANETSSTDCLLYTSPSPRD